MDQLEADTSFFFNSALRWRAPQIERRSSPLIYFTYSEKAFPWLSPLEMLRFGSDFGYSPSPISHGMLGAFSLCFVVFVRRTVLLACYLLHWTTHCSFNTFSSPRTSVAKGSCNLNDTVLHLLQQSCITT